MNTEVIFKDLLRVVQAETVWRQSTSSMSSSGSTSSSPALMPSSLRQSIQSLTESFKSTGHHLTVVEINQLGGYFVKVIVRLLQVSVSLLGGKGQPNPTTANGKVLEQVKQQLVDVITCWLTFQHLIKARTNQAQVKLDGEVMISIYSHLSYVFIAFLLPFFSSPANHSLAATEEHLLQLILDALLALFHFFSNDLDTCLMFFQGLTRIASSPLSPLDWLANLIHSLLTVIQHTHAKHITNSALFVLKQLLLLTKSVLFSSRNVEETTSVVLSKSLKAFWRASLPGVFSTLVNFCAQSTVKR